MTLLKLNSRRNYTVQRLKILSKCDDPTIQESYINTFLDETALGRFNKVITWNAGDNTHINQKLLMPGEGATERRPRLQAVTKNKQTPQLNICNNLK